MNTSALGKGLSAAALLVGGIVLGNAAGCSSMKPGNTQAVAPVTDRPRVGNVYLLRGFIGVFSTGIDHLGEEAIATGVRAEVFQDSQWSDLADHIVAKYHGQASAEPIVLVGHSYGADDVVRIARKLDAANVPVRLLITLDPVTAPAVPKNVELCVNLYQSNGAWDNLPWLRGVPLKQDSTSSTHLVNANIRVDRTDLLEPDLNHFNIEKKKKVHGEVLRQIEMVCVPREKWVAAHAVRPEMPLAGLVPQVSADPISARRMATSSARQTPGPATKPTEAAARPAAAVVERAEAN